jgi:hypothetical protein
MAPCISNAATRNSIDSQSDITSIPFAQMTFSWMVRMIVTAVKGALKVF